MKKFYTEPEFELVNIRLLSDILFDSKPETDLPEIGDDDEDFNGDDDFDGDDGFE